MAAIGGTEGSDVLVGTSGEDVIDGLGGDDQLSGGAGNDLLRGGGGSDRLNGGAGDDVIEGGDGNDYLTENDGGSDTLTGGSGDDEIAVSRFGSGARNERLSIQGGTGRDRIFYYNGDAVGAEIDAGADDDFVSLEGVSQGTVVTLGTGRDVLDLSRAQLMLSSPIVVTDFAIGATGDRMQWLQLWSDYLIGWNQSLNPFSTGHLRLEQRGTDAVLLVDSDGSGAAYAASVFMIFENASASAFTAINLDGYAPDGSVPAAQLLSGTGGGDLLTGGGGADTVDGLAGDDQLIGGGGDDLIRGGLGDDRLEGGPGSDRLEGGDGQDSLYDGHGGSDVLDGGSGDDSIFLYRIGRSLNEVVAVLGGAGRDRISLWSYAAGTVTVDAGADDDIVTLWTASNSQHLTLGTGRDTIDLNHLQTFGMSATARTVADFATGPTGDNLLLQDLLTGIGWPAADNPFASGHLRLIQRGGDAVLQIDPPFEAGDWLDLLVFRNRSATAFTAENFGGFAPDGSAPAGQTIIGSASADALEGGFGSDRIEGLDGDDRLSGKGGNDVLLGGSGNDTIDGGSGDDILDGGAGDDFFQPTGGGSDIIRGGGGRDFIFYFRNWEGLTEVVTIDGGDDADRIIYQNFNPGGVTINAGAGDDQVSLHASRGATDLTLGAGRDQLDLTDFYFAEAQGTITVNDFDPSQEVIGWATFLARGLIGWDGRSNPIGAGFVQMVQDGADVRITIDRDAAGGAHDAKPFMVLKNTALAALTAAALDGYGPDGIDPDRTERGTDRADTLTGGSGNDLLDGGVGADRMTGGAGNDVFVVDDFGDVVSEAAGEGVDTVRTAIGSRSDYTQLYTLASNVEGLTGTGAAGQGVRANALDNVVTMGAGADLLVLDDGGVENVSAGGGNDFIYYGATLTAADTTDGGAGVDTVGLLGSYSLTLGANSLVGVERIAMYTSLQGGTGTANSYAITTVDANVAGGAELFVIAASLTAGETLTFNGSAERDGRFTVLAGAGADVLVGGARADYLAGGAGGDQLFGLDGNDTLVGGAGADVLRGGNGRDVFEFTAATDSTAAARDTIVDFNAGVDRIDLSQIDAVAGTGGNEAFAFIGSAAFGNSAGQLRAFQANGSWFVEGDTNGDGVADFALQVMGSGALGAGDFLL